MELERTELLCLVEQLEGEMEERGRGEAVVLWWNKEKAGELFERVVVMN